MRENVKNEVEKFIIYFSNRANDTKTTKRVISVNLHFNTSNFRNFSTHKTRRGVVRRWNEQSRSQNMTMKKKICVLCGEKNWILTIWRLLGRGERERLLRLWANSFLLLLLLLCFFFASTIVSARDSRSFALVLFRSFHFLRPSFVYAPCLFCFVFLLGFLAAAQLGEWNELKNIYKISEESSRQFGKVTGFV